MIARRTFALVAALLVLAGCSDSSQPTLSTPAPAAELLSESISVNGLLQFTGSPDVSGTRHAEKRIIASEGGFVELNGFRVDIPAGALPADTTVTLDLPTDELLAKRVVAEFGPHGIQFNTPVTLTFPLTGVVWNGDPIEVARWENGAWTSLGGSVDLVANVLRGTTPRFSSYGGKVVLAGG